MINSELSLTFTWSKTTGNLLDYEYFLEHYTLIVIDLSKQIKLENPDLKQQINFIKNKLILLASLKKEQQYFLSLKKSEETTFKFLENSVSII